MLYYCISESKNTNWTVANLRKSFKRLFALLFCLQCSLSLSLCCVLTMRVTIAVNVLDLSKCPFSCSLFRHWINSFIIYIVAVYTSFFYHTGTYIHTYIEVFYHNDLSLLLFVSEVFFLRALEIFFDSNCSFFSFLSFGFFSFSLTLRSNNFFYFIMSARHYRSPFNFFDFKLRVMILDFVFLKSCLYSANEVDSYTSALFTCWMWCSAISLSSVSCFLLFFPPQYR